MSQRDYLHAASYVFERERGRSMDDFELGCIEAEGLDRVEPKALREAVQELLASGNLSVEERSLACFALGKTCDVSFKPLFQRQLRFELAGESGAVYQILICLEDLGESVFGADRDGSFSVIDDELNRRDARAYLATLE